MNITPLTGKIYLSIEKPTAGGLDLSSKPTAVEYGEVIAVGGAGEGKMYATAPLRAGAKIFVKAWGLDLITYQGETYYFVDMDSKAICAVITND